MSTVNVTMPFYKIGFGAALVLLPAYLIDFVLRTGIADYLTNRRVGA